MAFGPKSLGLFIASSPVITDTLMGKAIDFILLPALRVAAWGSGLQRILGSHLGSARSAVTDEQCLLWTWEEGVVAGVLGVYCSCASAAEQGDCLRKSQGQEGGVAQETEKGRTGYFFFNKSHCSVLSGKRNMLWRNMSN